MRVEELSGTDAQVYRAVAELEDGSLSPQIRDIARHAGLSVEEARAAVHRLLHTEPKILREVPDTGVDEFGPAYELAPRI
jgi:hypothetical protein